MKILVVDDEELQRETLKGFLENKGYQVYSAASGAEALRMFNAFPIQLALLDHRMPDMAGDELLARMKAINPFLRAVMITAYGAVGTAVRVMQLGAEDFLEKPVDLLELLGKIENIEQQLAIEEDAASVSETMETGLELPLQVIGASLAMRKLLSTVRRVSQTPWTVLIRGETGTGKELIARLIHLLSARGQAPFIEVNCAAIPENLFESELFGHEKGAFTGATGRRKGRFELAQSGSLFLDEVGELPLTLQAKLLRALQEKRISRVGSETELEVDVRVLAATNRDLRQLTSEGKFRGDLFYRLQVLEIEVPPLRDRREDIPLLVDFFLARYSGSHPLRFDPEALATLIKYPFPGNVRELEHFIQRTVTMVRGPVVRLADLPAEMRYHQANEGGLAERLEAVEREMLIAALQKYEWVQTRAAESLGISERVLRYKMAKHGIKKQ